MYVVSTDKDINPARLPQVRVELKNGNAADVAKIIAELFNGPKQTQSNVPAWMMARFRSIMPQDTKPEAVRVVADPASNSLLVQASPINLMTIRRLLNEALDRADTDSNAVAQTFIIPLKYAVASEVAAVLKDVYKEHMNTTSDASQLRGRRGVWPWPMRPTATRTSR